VESPVIEFLLVPAVVLAVLLSLRSRASLRGQARRKIVAALTVVAGVVAVLVPDILQALADAVGVGRGTDLLLYVLGIVTIYLVGSTSARFREQEAKLARLSRQVALADTEARLAVRSPASRTRSTDVPSPGSAAPPPGQRA
jgi:hypothetical protein